MVWAAPWVVAPAFTDAIHCSAEQNFQDQDLTPGKGPCLLVVWITPTPNPIAASGPWGSRRHFDLILYDSSSPGGGDPGLCVPGLESAELKRQSIKSKQSDACGSILEAGGGWVQIPGGRRLPILIWLEFHLESDRGAWRLRRHLSYSSQRGEGRKRGQVVQEGGSSLSFLFFGASP